MQPVRNQILFKPLPADEISLQGLFIPENAREVNNKGVIVKVGKGLPKRPMKLKEGDVCYRVKDWGEPLIANGELYFLMDENAILAKE